MLNQPHALQVRFVDYGNTWYTSLSEILVCPEPYRGPGFAVPFSGQLNQTTPVRRVSSSLDITFVRI